MDIGDVINGWRIVEDAGAGRSGHVFIVCREGDPDRLFALKMQRTDRPDVAPDANAREAALLRAGMKKSPRVMPELVEIGEWRGVPFFVMERIEGIDFPIPTNLRGQAPRNPCKMGLFAFWRGVGRLLRQRICGVRPHETLVK